MFMLRDPRGQVYPIPEQGLRIGRAAGNDLVLADEEVSRYHATVWVQGGQAYIRDENSTNGTWVNEQRIFAPTPLRPGDRIRVGQTVLEVVGREPGVTVASVPGMARPSPPPTHPVASSAVPPLATSPPAQSLLPLILGIGGGILLLICGAVILLLAVFKAPLPGIALRPSPTPTPTATPTRTPTPTPTPAPPDAWIIILQEDFEGSFPGDWELRGSEDYQWSRSSCRSYAGSYSAWAVGGGEKGEALDCGRNYPNDLKSGIVYGPFSLEGATAAELKFRFWLKTEIMSDWLCYNASDDGESFYGPCVTGSGEWSEEVLDLSEVSQLGNLLGRPRVWIGFFFKTDASETMPEGAYLDNIILRKCNYPGGRCR